MIEEKLKLNHFNTIYLKYDKTKYQIEHVKNVIILKRLSDNQVLEVLDDRVGFIIQYDCDNITNFILTSYLDFDIDRSKPIKLKHYIDDGKNDSLILKNEFECRLELLDECHITDKSYIVEEYLSTAKIYNLEELSIRYHSIYYGPDIKKIFNNNTILVTNKLKSYDRDDIVDTITYGINPETFEITTPIWSELQQRYIEVYTKEKVATLNKELVKNCIYLKGKINYDDATIDLEVQHYLEELSYYLDLPKEVYVDKKLNEEFVKKFVK